MKLTRIVNSFVKGLVTLINPGKLSLIDKRILITGCDAGYGFSLALWCKEQGMQVTACCLQSENSQGRSRLTENGIETVGLDLTSVDSINSIRKIIQQRFEHQGLDYLVNNAAFLVFGEATWQTQNQVNRQIQVNMTGPLELMKICFPSLVKSKGRIINMISNCTDCPLPTLAVYTASKAGLKNLTIGMRPEMSKYGVQMVLVNPGDAPFHTQLCSGQLPHYQAMRREMAPAQANILGDYFFRCQEKYTTLFPRCDVMQLQDPKFYQTMNKVLTAKQPASEYENSEFVTRIIFGMIRVMPAFLADKARLALTKLPQYTRND